MFTFFLKSAQIKQVVMAICVTAVFWMRVPVALSDALHACRYLEKQEIERVVGVSVREIETHPANPMGQNICFYHLAGSGDTGFVQLQMIRTAWAKQAGKKWTAASLFHNNMSFLDGLETIKGTGEKALWGGAGLKMGAGLHVLFRDTYFTILAKPADPSKSLDMSRSLALIVINKIK